MERKETLGFPKAQIIFSILHGTIMRHSRRPRWYHSALILLITKGNHKNVERFCPNKWSRQELWCLQDLFKCNFHYAQFLVKLNSSSFWISINPFTLLWNWKVKMSHWITEKARELKKNIHFCFIDFTQTCDCVDHNKRWKILQEMGIPDHLTCLLRNLYVVQEATVRKDMEKWTESKLGKEYVKAVYCHPAYLTYMQSTSCEMPGWIKHKLESRLLGEISNFRYADDITLMAESKKKLNSLLMKVSVKKLA